MSFLGEGTSISVGTAEQTIIMGNITSRNIVIGNLTYPGFDIGNRSLLVNGGLEVNGNLLVNGTKIAIGSLAGTTSQGASSVAIGREAGQTSQGSNAVAIGFDAGDSSQGVNAVAVGVQAGQTSQGGQSVAVGYQSGSNAQGANSVAVGYIAGRTTQGAQSVAIGWQAGLTNLAANSVAIGRESVSTGSNSTALGYAASTSTFTNSTALGKSATCTSNNQIMLGTSSETVSIPGNLGIQTTAPTQMLGIQGTMRVNQANNTHNKLLVLYDAGTADAVATATAFFGFGVNANTLRYQVNTNGENHTFFGGSTQYGRINNNTSGFQIGSDRKLKKNITELDYGLHEILQLKPSRYLMKEENEGDKTHIGLIAQEVQPILPEVVHEQLENDNTTTLMLSHIGFIPVLIRAIQEQEQHIQNLEDRLRTLENSR